MPPPGTLALDEDVDQDQGQEGGKPKYPENPFPKTGQAPQRPATASAGKEYPENPFPSPTAARATPAPARPAAAPTPQRAPPARPSFTPLPAMPATPVSPGLGNAFAKGLAGIDQPAAPSMPIDATTVIGSRAPRPDVIRAVPDPADLPLGDRLAASMRAAVSEGPMGRTGSNPVPALGTAAGIVTAPVTSSTHFVRGLYRELAAQTDAEQLGGQREALEAGFQLGAMLLGGPEGGGYNAVGEAAAPAIGSRLAGALETTGAGAFTGATFTPQDPAQGAVVGGLLSGALNEAAPYRPRATRRVPELDPARAIAGSPATTARATFAGDATAMPQPAAESVDETLAKAMNERQGVRPGQPITDPGRLLGTPTPATAPLSTADATARFEQQGGAALEQSRAASERAAATPEDQDVLRQRNAAEQEFEGVMTAAEKVLGPDAADQLRAQLLAKYRPAAATPAAAPHPENPFPAPATPAAAPAHPENPFPADIVEREERQPGEEPPPPSARNARGRLPVNLTKLPDEAIATEYRKLMDEHQQQAQFVEAHEADPATEEARNLRTEGNTEDAEGVQSGARRTAAGFAKVNVQQRAKAIARLEAELTKRGIAHADAYWLGGGEAAPTAADEKPIPFERGPKYGKPSGTTPSLFAQPDMFGGAGTMAETDVGRGGKLPKSTGEAPAVPGAISAEEMAARRDELGAPKSEAETLAKATPEQGTLFDRPAKVHAFGTEQALDQATAWMQKRGKHYPPEGVPAAAARRSAVKPATRRPWVDLRGQKADSPVKLKELLAPFRHPQMERLHVILQKSDGTILSHTMETSGVINYVDVGNVRRWVRTISERALRLGATHVTLAHNHPSGDPTPSADDRAFTLGMGYALQKLGLRQVGHLVTDHGKATWIEPGPGGTTVDGFSTPPPAMQGAKDWTDVQGAKVNTVEQMARLLGTDVADGQAHVLYLNTQNEAVALEPHRMAAMKTAATWIQKHAKALGASNAVVVVPAGQGRATSQALLAGKDTAVYDVVELSVGNDGVVTYRSLGDHGGHEYERPEPKKAPEQPRRLFEKPADFGKKEKTGPPAKKVEEPGEIEVAAQEVTRLGDAIKKLFAPTTRSPGAAVTGRLIREHAARMAQELEHARESMKAFAKSFRKMAPSARLDFIHRLETGQPQATRELTRAAAVMRLLLDRTRDEVRALGTGRLEHWIENYFPHIWKDPKKAKSVMAQILGKRPLQGPKSFLKQRSIPTVQEGIARGLELETDNPVELTLLKLKEMKRYLFAQRILAEMQGRKLANYVPSHAKLPDGYQFIDDSVATVYGPPEMTVSEGFDAGLRKQLETIVKNLKIKYTRKPGIGSEALGWAKKFPEELAAKFGTESIVIEHELGHILDFRYDLWNRLVQPGPAYAKQLKVKQTKEAIAERQKVKRELRALADLRYEGDDVTPHYKKYVRKQTEQIANAVHAFIHAPARMGEVAPTVKAKLGDFLRHHEELRPILDVRPSLKVGSDTAPVKIPGLRIMGRYAAPEAAAFVINNYLAPGLRGNPLYDLYQGLNDSLNMAQLGLSAFHLGFTSVDAAVSQASVGLQNAIAGRVLKGIGQMVTSPFAAPATWWRGNKLLKAYLLPNGKPGELLSMVDAVIAGGGRARPDSFFQDSYVKKLMEAIRHRRLVATARFALPGLLEAAMKPIMVGIVPRMKLGVFMQLAEHEFATLPKDATRDEFRRVMGRAWDATDDRLGQVVYDNLFWNRTMKDMLHASVRSVGWNMGTIRGLGTGVRDVARIPKSREMTPAAAYVMMLPIVIGILGALITYLMTGKGPKEAKDYFYPPTGRKNAEGDMERWQLPSYMKDMLAYGRHPVATIGHKLSPLLGLISEMLRNEDFYGDEIQNNDDPFVQRRAQDAEYLLKELEPFSFRNKAEAETRGGSTIEKVGGFFGLTVAPREETRSPAQDKIMEFAAKAAGHGATPEEAEARKERADLVRQVQLGTKTDEDVERAEDLGKLTGKQRAGIERAEQLERDVWLSRFNRLPVDQALTVFKLKGTTAAEREAWRDAMEAKLTRAGREDEIDKLP